MNMNLKWVKQMIKLSKEDRLAKRKIRNLLWLRREHNNRKLRTARNFESFKKIEKYRQLNIESFRECSHCLPEVDRPKNTRPDILDVRMWMNLNFSRRVGRNIEFFERELKYEA